jgi:hypothetical protein
MEEERLQILKMVQEGRIGADEAAQLLAALDCPPPEAVDAPLGVERERPARPQDHWARFWIYPMMVGGAVLILGLLVVTLAYTTGAAAFWLLCGWLPLILGLVVVLLALWSRRATWMHLRISEEGQRKMALSFPLPLTLAAWGLRVAQPFVPQLAETGADDVIIALRDTARQGEPLFIDVQDDEKGERVELYFG